MVMVYVPAGEFLMGSTNADSDARDSEKPQHTVYLDGYWIDKTEVTYTQYRRCVQAGWCTEPVNNGSVSRDSYFGNSSFDYYPVVYVDWERANALCQWAGARLPTEAEWEEAARGTDGRLYPWGDGDPKCDRANFGDSKSGFCVGDTTWVGSYLAGASPYGALDMAGNVEEWVAERVQRGDGFQSYQSSIRAAWSSRTGTPYARWGIGFRCAASPGE